VRVCVIGTGYVGLVTGTCLAYMGNEVICVDNNEAKVRVLRSGQSPIHEPGLPALLQTVLDKQKIEFTTDIAHGIAHGEIIFIAVGTPALPDGQTDLRYLEAVASSLGKHMDDQYRVIVNKSTVPIGSGDWVRMIILEGMAAAGNPHQPNFDIISNPEFLREGSAVYDTFNPDRIVLGGESSLALSKMQTLYQGIIDRTYADDPSLPPVPVVITDINSAEMIKYAANAFLAVKISFINEIANICDRVGADVREVARGIGLDSRIGQRFLQAGVGWGGSCFGKDVAALIHTAADYGYSAAIMQAAVKVNQQQRLLVVEKLQQTLKILKGKTIGLLGLTFKPNTDDMRDAPALTIIEQLHRLGAKVKAYDPIVSQSGLRDGLSHVSVETDVERLADGCDALVLVTDWLQFREMDYAHLGTLMHQPVLIDGRNFLDRATLEQAGFKYIGIGC